MIEREICFVFIVLGVCADPLCLVTEFVENGALLDYIRKNTLTSVDLVKFSLDTAAGMSHLHQEGLIHRDLAARNLLVTASKSLKVSDFGLSTYGKTELNQNLRLLFKDQYGSLFVRSFVVC